MNLNNSRNKKSREIDKFLNQKLVKIIKLSLKLIQLKFLKTTKKITATASTSTDNSSQSTIITASSSQSSSQNPAISIQNPTQNPPQNPLSIEIIKSHSNQLFYDKCKKAITKKLLFENGHAKLSRKYFTMENQNLLKLVPFIKDFIGLAHGTSNDDDGTRNDSQVKTNTIKASNSLHELNDEESVVFMEIFNSTIIRRSLNELYEKLESIKSTSLLSDSKKSSKKNLKATANNQDEEIILDQEWVEDVLNDDDSLALSEKRKNRRGQQARRL